MRLSLQEFLHHEDRDIEPLMCADDLPWDEAWDESPSLFDPLEPQTMLKSMPSSEELLAIDTLTDQRSDEAEFEDFAEDE